MRDVVLKHMHYDHVGNFDKFPNARFHLQEREMAYATGKYMRYPRIGNSYHVEDVVGMVRLNFKGRVEMHSGEIEIARGITLHPTYGHSDGLQSVRVHTKRGWLVLASDATHYYENMATNRPFTTAFHIGQMITPIARWSGWRQRRGTSCRHDPYVMTNTPRPTGARRHRAVRLDSEPVARHCLSRRRAALACGGSEAAIQSLRRVVRRCWVERARRRPTSLSCGA